MRLEEEENGGRREQARERARCILPVIPGLGSEDDSSPGNQWGTLGSATSRPGPLLRVRLAPTTAHLHAHTQTHTRVRRERRGKTFRETTSQLEVRGREVERDERCSVLGGPNVPRRASGCSTSLASARTNEPEGEGEEKEGANESVRTRTRTKVHRRPLPICFSPLLVPDSKTHLVSEDVDDVSVDEPLGALSRALQVQSRGSGLLAALVQDGDLSGLGRDAAGLPRPRCHDDAGPRVGHRRSSDGAARAHSSSLHLSFPFSLAVRAPLRPALPWFKDAQRPSLFALPGARNRFSLSLFSPAAKPGNAGKSNHKGASSYPLCSSRGFQRDFCSRPASRGARFRAKELISRLGILFFLPFSS